MCINLGSFTRKKVENHKPRAYSLVPLVSVGRAYRRPDVFFSSLMLFSGTFPPPNHFLVAENRERLIPFLETSCREQKEGGEGWWVGEREKERDG